MSTVPKEETEEEENSLTVTTPLPAEEAGFTEAAGLSAPLRRRPSLSSFAAQQGVGQDLQTTQPQSIVTLASDL